MTTTSGWTLTRGTLGLELFRPVGLKLFFMAKLLDWMLEAKGDLGLCPWNLGFISKLLLCSSLVFLATWASRVPRVLS